MTTPATPPSSLSDNRRLARRCCDCYDTFWMGPHTVRCPDCRAVLAEVLAAAEREPHEWESVSLGSMKCRRCGLPPSAHPGLTGGTTPNPTEATGSNAPASTELGASGATSNDTPGSVGGGS